MSSTSKGPEDAAAAGHDVAETTAAGAPPRAPWVRPRLDILGDVRDLTMGGSPGVFESNNPGTRRNKRP
jgi:hypothetical protein